MKTIALLFVMGILAPTVWGQTLLSQNQPVTASSYQTGNVAANGNDGNLTTRWTASGATYPQWWQVDLGSTQTVSQAVIDWYDSTSRAYQYQVQSSLDGTNYAVLADNTSNATYGNTTNSFFAPARYVRIYVTGCTASSGYAAFYECQIFGPPPLQPYAADANTLMLFHCDETGGSVTTNWGTLGGNAYCVSNSTDVAVPPTVTNILGATAYTTNFGTAAAFTTSELLGYDYNRNGYFDADVSSSEPSADAFPMSLLNMGNGGPTPWTLEAAICPTITNANQEIITTDSSSGNRGFQFRLDTAGQLELNLISVASADFKAAIPTLASDPTNGYVANTWYHVAATYDGTNVVLYWTKMTPSTGVANAISTNTVAVGATFGGVMGPLGIGNRTRGAATETFQGKIDEVRISNVARAATQMFFSSNAFSVSPATLAPANPVYAGTVVTFAATVSGATALTYAWQCDGGTSGVTWTNLANSTTNSYPLDTTGMAAGLYEYRLVVSGSSGSLASAPVTLDLLAASGPVLVSNTSINPSAILFAGGSATLSAAFTGTRPMTYQWFFTSNGVATPLTGATNATYTLTGLQPGSSGGYYLVAANNPPGLGAQSSFSTPATLTVLPVSSSESGLYCELLEHPEQTQITASNPKFGWNYLPAFNNDSQTGYRIIVSSSLTLASAGTGDLWDSGQVASANSLNVVYAGSPLQASTNYFWRVQTRNSVNDWGAFSAIQQFNTASQLFNAVTTGGVVYQQPAAGSINCYPLRYVPVTPVLVTTNSLGHVFIDFGNDAFGYATVQINGNYAGANVAYGLGELAANNIVNTSPGATIRYWSGNFTLQNGNGIYTNRSTTAISGISPPTASYGIVSPFRYLELSGLPAGVTLNASNVTQMRLQTEFNDNAATFSSSSTALNQVWNLCHYSMKALSFDGIYVDGDRERTPYEADSYIHMLSSAGANNDFTQVRCSFEYLTGNLTWPTEWPMHMVFIAWADYQQTGDTYLLSKYYGFLTNKCMLYGNAGANGLVWSYPSTNNNHGTPSDIIDWYRISGDGIGNVDGYVAGGTNSVINAFYYRCLTIMTNVAQLTGHPADAANFAARAALVYSNYNSIFWNGSSQSYNDCMDSTHSSADANFYPLAFGLVPASNQVAVVNYLHSRIAAIKAMPAGVYGAQYLLEGLFEAGDADTSLGLLTTNNTRSWMTMINLGSTITAEAWSVADKSNEDLNHAWGAAPGNLIPRFVLGVRPLTAGYGQILIQPQLGKTLSFVQGTVPTIRGPVSVAVTNGAVYQLAVTIPGNVTASILVPTFSATNPVAILDGQIVASTVSSNWLTVAGVGSGQHVLWLSTNSSSVLATIVAGTTNFVITSTSLSAGGDTMTITVNGLNGHHYTLQETPSLDPALISWSNVGATQTATADNQPITFTNSSLTGTTQSYFRVVVTYP